jgi:hypothetical protein
VLADIQDVGSGAESEFCAELHYRALKTSFADFEAGTPDTEQPRTSRSEFIAAPLPEAAIRELIDAFRAGASGRKELNFTPLGGAYNRVPADATAFVHRSDRFVLEHVGVGAEAAAWADRSWEIAHAHASGRVYPNFPDLRLADPAAAYHGSNHDRLVAAKRHYDPQRFFRFAQSL